MNPDAVFRDSRLWSEEMRRERARAQGIAVDELEDFYRKRNILARPILPEDVAEAVLFLASDRSAKTTGCTHHGGRRRQGRLPALDDDAELRRVPLACIRPSEQFALARRCEALGLDSLWTGDHVSFHNPLYESLTLLASYAAITSRIKLGSGVYLLALRRPTVVAKITSTLDALCGGRLIFGVGVGGENPKEFEACGVPHHERGRPRHRGHRRGAHALARHAGLASRAASPSSRA